MRLGEFRTITRELGNEYIIRLSDYTGENNEAYDNIEVDIVTKDTIYLRKIK